MTFPVPAKHSTCNAITLCFPQVASYGVKPKYGLVTYATDTNVLIKVSQAESSNAAWVTEELNKISYEGQKSGMGVVGGSLCS